MGGQEKHGDRCYYNLGEIQLVVSGKVFPEVYGKPDGAQVLGAKAE